MFNRRQNKYRFGQRKRFIVHRWMGGGGGDGVQRLLFVKASLGRKCIINGGEEEGRGEGETFKI